MTPQEFNNEIKKFREQFYAGSLDCDSYCKQRNSIMRDAIDHGQFDELIEIVEKEIGE